MKHLVKFPLDTGGSVIVEVDDPAPDLGGGTLRGFGQTDVSQVLTNAEQSLDLALDGIQPAAEAILAKLTNLSQRPNEVEVTFGLKINAKFGIVIASGDVEANFTIALKWLKPTSPEDNKPK